MANDTASKTDQADTGKTSEKERQEFLQSTQILDIKDPWAIELRTVLRPSASTHGCAAAIYKKNDANSIGAASTPLPQRRNWFDTVLSKEDVDVKVTTKSVAIKSFIAPALNPASFAQTLATFHSFQPTIHATPSPAVLSPSPPANECPRCNQLHDAREFRTKNGHERALCSRCARRHADDQAAWALRKRQEPAKRDGAHRVTKAKKETPEVTLINVRPVYSFRKVAPSQPSYSLATALEQASRLHELERGQMNSLVASPQDMVHSPLILNQATDLSGIAPSVFPELRTVVKLPQRPLIIITAPSPPPPLSPPSPLPSIFTLANKDPDILRYTSLTDPTTSRHEFENAITRYALCIRLMQVCHHWRPKPNIRAFFRVDFFREIDVLISLVKANVLAPWKPLSDWFDLYAENAPDIWTGARTSATKVDVYSCIRKLIKELEVAAEIERQGTETEMKMLCGKMGIKGWEKELERRLASVKQSVEKDCRERGCLRLREVLADRGDLVRKARFSENWDYDG